MNTLTDLRGQIDGIDDQLAALFEQRLAVVQLISREKAAVGGCVRDKGREQEILGRVCDGCGAFAPYTRAFFRHILSLSRKMQRNHRAG